MEQIKEIKAGFSFQQQGELTVITRNGKPQFCPFKPTMLIPGQIQGQMIMHREPCGDWCPLFADWLTDGKPAHRCQANKETPKNLPF